MNTHYHSRQRQAAARLHVVLIVLAAICLIIALRSGADVLSGFADGFFTNPDAEIIGSP
jgi:hypothetical protein